jgi:DedD protein
MMDRALQERIVGAAVLVLVMVLVVPVFLDGPGDDGEMRTERVPLPGQAGQETRTVVLDRDRTEPVPSNRVTESPEPAAQPAPRKVEPEIQLPEPEPELDTKPEPVAEEPAQTETAPVAATSTTGMWAVQLGSFSNQENADRLAAELRKSGHAAFLSQVSTSAGQRHRVRIGPQKDRESADAVAAQLRAEGHDVKVLPHP